MNEGVSASQTPLLARRWPAPRWVTALIPVASVLGMLVSAYLTWVHYGGSKALCTGVGDCETVNNSPYAQVAGIPIAIFGFGMYLALFGLALYGPRAPASLVPNITLAVFGISLAGVLASAYLTYIEIAVIHAICPWCVISAILITLIFAVSIYDVTRMTREI